MDITRLPVEIQRMIAQRASEEDNAFMAGTSRHMQEVFGAENDRRVSQRARIQGPRNARLWPVIRARFYEDGVTADGIVHHLEEQMPTLLRTALQEGVSLDQICSTTITVISATLTPGVPPSSGRWTGHIWRYINAVRRITRSPYNPGHLAARVRHEIIENRDISGFNRAGPDELINIQRRGETIYRCAALLNYLMFPDFMEALDEEQD